MMYKVYLNDSLIYYKGDENLSLIEPVLNLSLNKAGTFEFAITNEHSEYENIERLTSYIKITKDNEIIFYGRVIDINIDLNSVKKVLAVGELSFLMDTIQEPRKFQNYTIKDFLSEVIDRHNKESNHKFYVGRVTVKDNNDSIYRFTNYENTLDVIMKKLVERLGGYINIRYEENKRYLDYLEDLGRVSNQKIEFRENILDLSIDEKSNIITRLIPLGARLETSSIEGLEEYLTIESINDGKRYIDSPLVNTYGVITGIVHFDNVTEPRNLLRKGKEYLENMSLTSHFEVKAIDLHLVDKNIEELRLGDKMAIKLKDKDINTACRINTLSLHFDSPINNTITLGDDVTSSISSLSREENQKLKEEIEKRPVISDVRLIAKEKATDLINDATTGHIVTRKNEILIMDSDDKETARKMWRWNLNGLGYSKNGYKGPFETAITMDGGILGDKIVAGSISAEKLDVNYKNGIESKISTNARGIESSVKKADFGTLLRQNSENVRLSWNKSSQYIQFETSGYRANISIYDGMISTNNKRSKIDENGIHFYRDGYYLGKIGTNQFTNDSSKKGIVFDLENEGSYMTWAVKEESSADSYTTKWTYWNKDFDGNVKDSLSAGCDINMRGFSINNARFNGLAGLTGRLEFVQVMDIDAEGKAEMWTRDCYIEFRNGICIGGSWNNG